MTRDPIGYEGGINLYGFCAGNPTNFIDPMGLDWLDDLSNFWAGAGDSLTFGGTGLIRAGLGVTVVDEDSPAYLLGEATETGVELLASMGTSSGKVVARQGLKAVGGSLAKKTLGPKNFTANKRLLRQWAKDPVKGTRAASIRYHVSEHGGEVGATNAWQYMRKAEAFNQNLRGATRKPVSNNNVRCTKDGKYIIKNPQGEIVSFGKAR